VGVGLEQIGQQLGVLEDRVPLWRVDVRPTPRLDVHIVRMKHPVEVQVQDVAAKHRWRQ
jgi:hypothetical protein